MIKGIIPPMVTPLRDWNELDHKGIENLIEHILSGGVHGLFILGTTGEGTNLSYELRRELIQHACNQINGSVPVLVGITDTSLMESVKMAEHAAECGADAVVAAPPYYFTSNQKELLHYYDLLAGKISLPLFLYNMPSHTKLSFEPETVKVLAGHSNIIGFKDSSGDAIYFQKVTTLLKDVNDFSVFVGPEEILMHTLLSGAHGGVNGGANMFPKLYVEMYKAANEKNFERITPLQEKIMHVSSAIYTVGDSPASYLQGLKCALSIMGICNDAMAAPYQAFDKETRRIIETALKELDVEEVLN